jgi:hypothetical protein
MEPMIEMEGQYANVIKLSFSRPTKNRSPRCLKKQRGGQFLSMLKHNM